MAIETITGTGSDPAKTMPGCCPGKPSKADQICELLEEILACFKDIKIGDVTLNVDLTEVKVCLDDILACLKEIKVDIKELCTKVANLEKLLQENNLLLGQIKSCITKMHEEIVACLKDIKASNEEIVACLKELKLSDKEILKCLNELKLTATEILGCFKQIKESFVECCIAEGQLQQTAKCQSFNRSDPFGDGLASSTYSVGVNGNWIDLPNPHTHADVIAALNSLCGSWQIIPNPNDPEKSTICNTDLSCPAVSFRYCRKGENTFVCGISTSTAIVVEPEENCSQYLRVWTKYEKPVADNIQNIDSNISALLEKACESKVDCLKCAVFTIDPEAVIENVVTGVQGSSGSITPLPETANNAMSFAQQLSNLGYSVESVVGNVVTVCGSDLIYSYQLQSGDIVPADSFFEKQGELVCDPALAAKLDLNNQLMLENNNLLNELLKCLCKDCDPSDETCEVAVSSPNNPEGWSWISGPTANTAVTFPTPVDTDVPQDMVATVTTDCEQLNACFSACANAESVRLRFSFSHQQWGPGHSGFIFSVSGGQAVAVSSNNTTALTPSGGSAQQIGTAIGDPDDAGYANRWVEYIVPKSALCGEGVQVATGGFQGFDNASVFDESLSEPPTITIIGCE